MTNKYQQKINCAQPWLPEVWAEWESGPSEIFKRIEKSEFPPLFAEKSWTKGMPQKDTQMYYKPSETIGNTL